jgi:hypothetical protein
MKEIADAIMTKFNTTPNSLYTSVGGRMYNTEAPQNVTWPYIVFSFPTRNPDYMFTSEFENVRMQFSIFSLSQSTTEVDAIGKNLQTMFDWCALSVSGYFHVFMRRINNTQRKDDRPSWINVIEYRVMVEKT